MSCGWSDERSGQCQSGAEMLVMASYSETAVLETEVCAAHLDWTVRRLWGFKIGGHEPFDIWWVRLDEND